MLVLEAALNAFGGAPGLAAKLSALGVPTKPNTPNSWKSLKRVPPAKLMAIRHLLGPTFQVAEPVVPQDTELEDSLAYVRRELARALACASPSARREIIRHLKAQVTLLANLAAAGGLFGDGGHEASGPRRAAPG